MRTICCLCTLTANQFKADTAYKAKLIRETNQKQVGMSRENMSRVI